MTNNFVYGMQSTISIVIYNIFKTFDTIAIILFNWNDFYCRSQQRREEKQILSIIIGFEIKFKEAFIGVGSKTTVKPF